MYHGSLSEEQSRVGSGPREVIRSQMYAWRKPGIIPVGYQEYAILPTTNKSIRPLEPTAYK